MGSTAREDEVSYIFDERHQVSSRLEAFAFSSREFLRALLVGKEVAFTITHSLPANGGPGGVSLIKTKT